MGNSVITEKAIQENVKVSEKKQPESGFDSLLQQTDRNENKTESDSLEQAQEMIAQLKSILGGGENNAPPSLAPSESSKKEEKVETYSKLKSEKTESVQPELQETAVGVGKEYSHFFDESDSGKIGEDGKADTSPASKEGSELPEEKDKESSDVLEERLKVVKQLKNSLKKEMDKSKEKVGVESHESDTDTDESKTSEAQKSDKRELKEQHGVPGDNTKRYLNMKKEIEEGIKALERLKEGGFIDDEDYRKSREILVKKLELADFLLHKEAEKLTIVKLKEHVEKLIDEFMEEEGVKKEKEKLKLYLQALQKLYDQGVVSEDVYNKKRKIIEDKLATYDLVVDEIEMVFNSFLNRIKKEIVNAENELEKLSKHEEKIMKKEKEEKQEEKASLIKKLFSKKKSAEEDRKYRQVMRELEEIYAKNEGRKTISQMVLLVKKEVEGVLGIKEELTHAQLIERIKKDERVDAETKLKLTSFFEKMIVKEYAGEISDSDVHEVYEECKEILRTVFTDLKKSITEKVKEKSEKEDKEKNEERKSETESTEQEAMDEKLPKVEVKETESVVESASEKNEKPEPEKQEIKKKKSIFQKINEFFGV